MKRLVLAAGLLLSTSGCATLIDSFVDGLFESDPLPTSYEGRMREKFGEKGYNEYTAERDYRDDLKKD